MVKYLFFVFTVLYLQTQATQIPEAKARKIAKNFFVQQSGDTSRAYLIYQSTEFYVYNFTKGTKHGFVWMRANDNLKPIVGYSKESHFPIEGVSNNAHPFYGFFKLQKEITKAGGYLKNPVKSSKWSDIENGIRRVKASGTVVLPLTTAMWDQEPYYNKLCPGGSVTGCVSTGAGIIMKYWNWPPTGTGSASYCDCTPYYSNNYGTLSSNFAAHTYNWGNMPLTGVNASNCADIAQLLYDIGVAVNMDYATDVNGGSGAYGTGGTPSMQDAYSHYFNYKVPVGVYASSYSTSAWDSIMKDELKAGRPVNYEAFDNNGGGGHFFVLDGVDINSLYHFNFGWSSSGNGYYSINGINVSGYSFNSNQSAIIKIIPNGTVSPPSAPCGISTLTFTKPALTDTITASAFTNDSIYSWTYTAGAAPVTQVGSNKIIITAPYATTVTTTLNKVCRGGTTSQTTGSYTTPSNCGIPTGLTTTTATSPVPSATFSWQPVVGVASYLIWFGLNASNGGYSTVTVTGNSWKLNFGVTAGSGYFWKIRTNCTTTGTSAWSDTMRYTIGGVQPPPATCPTPTLLKETPTVQATISWTGSATNYILNYKIASTTNYTPVTGILGNSYTISNVVTDSLYNFNVVGVCNGVNSILVNGTFIGGK